MPSLLARAHRPAGHPDALGDLTLAELAALRLTEPGKRPTPTQLLGLILRMQDQVEIGQLVLKERITPQASGWTRRFLKTVTIALEDHYATPSERGTTKLVPYEHWSGPAPTDPKEYTETPDLVERVVTRQAAHDLHTIDPENWSEAALRWLDADKQLSLHEPTDQADKNTIETPISTADSQLSFKVFKVRVKGAFTGGNVELILKNRGDKGRPQPYAKAFNGNKTVNLTIFRDIAIQRGEWKMDREHEEDAPTLDDAMKRMSLVGKR